MRKYLSVFGLAARGSLWKGLAVTVLAAALAGLLLFLLPQQEMNPYYAGPGEKSEEVLSSYIFMEAAQDSCASIPLMVGFAALCAVLAGTGWGKGAKTGYTVARLRVKKNTACLLWTAYDFMALLLYWAVSAGVLLFAMVLRMKNVSPGGELDPLTLILTCYSTPLLHHLLPVGNVYAWGGNILGILACAVGCADVAEKKWRGQMGGIPLAIAVALTVCGFFVRLQNSGAQALYMAAQAALIGIVLYGWWGGDKREETDMAAQRP